MRKYALFTTAGIVAFLTTFAASAVAVALPEIRSDLNASILLTGWVISGYLLTFTLSVALGGRASDAFGQRPLFMFSLVVFTVGTALCLVAPNAQFLVAFRLIQGLGGGALIPISVGIVAQEFASNRQKALGLMMGVHPLGSLAGPNIGAWIVSSWGWKSVFWVILPMLAIAIITAAFTLRPGTRRESHLDLPGAGMLAAILSALVIGISLIKGSDTPWVMVTVLLIGGVAVVPVLVRREARISHPIVNLEFIRRRAFAASNTFNFLWGVTTHAGGSFIPLYAVAVYNETTLKSGVVMTPRSLGMLLISSLVAMSVLRVGYRLPLVVGSIAVGLSSLLLAMEPDHAVILGYHVNGADFLFLFMALAGIGHGAISAVVNNVCVDLAPQQAATVSGLRSMFGNMGGLVGTVAVTLLLNDNSTDLPHGFYLVFIGLSIVSLIGIPLTFAMPGCPIQAPTRKTG